MAESIYLALKLKTYYFTFMQRQVELKNSYAKIIAPTNIAAREIMFALFSDRWAFQYNSEEEAGVNEFNLTKLDLTELAKEKKVVLHEN